MRDALCQALVEQAKRPDFIFLTGDLGYNALEPLRAALGERFINAGVAEQNMVSAAAGLATTGWRPWAYSIAPFLYARPYEQIRNDVCLHDLPVRLAGNGGGYAYGVMGATHHALEDYGALLCLPNMNVFVPAFAPDVASAIGKLMDFEHPAYLRLGRAEEPRGYKPPIYAPWRRLFGGGGPAMLVVGPLAGALIEPLAGLDEARRPNLWVLSELPIEPETIPGQFMDDMRRSGHVFVVEEHVAQGGAGQALARVLWTMGAAPARFTHRHARGYVSGRYGSQDFHRKECGLDPASVLAEVGRRHGLG